MKKKATSTLNPPSKPGPVTTAPQTFQPTFWLGLIGILLIGVGLGVGAAYFLAEEKDTTGMVWIKGGEFVIGHEKFPESRPLRQIQVDGFWMDTTEVTNAQWKKFVDATGYVTIAEKVPTIEQYPGAKPENLVAGSLVFAPPKDITDAQIEEALKTNRWDIWWTYGKGANWKHPLGPDSNIEGKDDYPVVHIAYLDALEYCKWAKKRLPTEAEWEFAARGGLEQKPYYWGDEKLVDGKHMANTYQGKFPRDDSGEDGFKGIAPVKQYKPNAYGLYDMSGNVWEWCSDWYQQDAYQNIKAKNPQGPDKCIDPRPGMSEMLRVTRGGSFLCADNYCIRYMAGARHHGSIDTGTNHTGFRCVRSR